MSGRRSETLGVCTICGSDDVWRVDARGNAFPPGTKSYKELGVLNSTLVCGRCGAWCATGWVFHPRGSKRTPDNVRIAYLKIFRIT